ncbi:MAG: amino acid permease [Bacteroidales bacterium]|nr:amino acid permease [Bacteroidales bacterium]
MSQAKKFGTFAGVFTPSILSILGVIMYLRLGWVVGEAGLFNALAIIITAHVISITTGLSISSIATDKKVKAGGIYYMLSRSLGLPMGGAIGIIRYAATSLSIGLFLIGFAENFLGIEAIRDFFHLGTTINDIRIVGSVAIIVLVVIAYISTSLAIKSQFVVFTAIIFSLLAIVMGLFLNNAAEPVEVALLPVENGMSFEAIFAIFFPAVSGFTVGVAMSGDLKDPKKAIPKGTMMAILVGFMVYVLLAILIASKVDRGVLLNNYNFLSDVSLWSPLVIAGVWAATLSAAIGGILGAPRILQALSTDKITPRVFGKGFGVNNEPRNALILTFIIAEFTILIGELNVVARIMSMFFLVAFGFINLSYVLESWASPDFRPSFKIPKWVAMAGFLISFAVMFKLDAMAMVISIVLTFLVYFFLSKRNLELEYGDVWQSVWSSVVRSSLIQVARKGIEERHWQPNIMLFSGRSEARPHLVEFGKQLIGNQGLLSNFDLVQIESNDKVLPRHRQVTVHDENASRKGFFSRQHFCTDIYEGIKNISSVYGFSGIEPNTVMLGWARQSHEPVKFIQTINYIKALDLNILLMDYDKRVGFGKYKLIDIWWRTTEHNGNLGLLLLKFLWLSKDWKSAKARILIVNPVNEQKHIIYRNTKEILENLRINAEIKIINNQVEQRSFYDIVQVESVNSDLIFLGLPDVLSGNEQDFVDETNKLCQDIGTVILIKASTTFKELNIGAKNILIDQVDTLPQIGYHTRFSSQDVPEFDLPDKPELTIQLRSFHNRLAMLAGTIEKENLSILFSSQDKLIAHIEKAIIKHIDNLGKKYASPETEDLLQSIAKYNAALWFRLRRLISDYSGEMLEIQSNNFREDIDFIKEEIQKITSESTLIVKIPITARSLRIHPKDSLQNKLFKIRYQTGFKLSRKKKKYHAIEYRRILAAFLEPNVIRLLHKFSENWGTMSSHFLMMNRTLFNDVFGILVAIDSKIATQSDHLKLLNEKREEALDRIGQMIKINNDNRASLSESITGSIMEMVGQFADEFRLIQSNRTLVKKFKLNGDQVSFPEFVTEMPAKWNSNQKLLVNDIQLELGLFTLVSKMKIIFRETEHDIASAFDEYIVYRQNEIRKQLLDQHRKIKSNPRFTFSLATFRELEHSAVMQVLFNQLIQNTFNKVKQASLLLPEKIEIMDPETRKALHAVQFTNVTTQTIFVSRLLDYLLQSEFVDSVQKSLGEISEKLIPIKTTTNEILRSLDFLLNPDSEIKNGEMPAHEQTEKIFTDHIAQLDKEIERSTQLKNTVVMMFHERLHTFEDKLTFYSFIENANNLKDYIRQREIRNRWRLFHHIRERGKEFVQHQLNQFWYRQSIGVIFTRRLKAMSAPVRFRVNDALAILEKISVKTEVDKKLPYYYRQLFIRKQYYLNELWAGRERELHEAERSIKRSLSGLYGAILVTGDHHSGKTFFSQYFINKYYPNASIFTLTPPYAGSTDVNLFKKSLENVFETSGSYYKIFNSLPEKSVLIIDDLALWWEQTEHGFEVVAQLIELIDKYSHRCLFVINLNRFSYELMRRINPIENYFISIIELQPFTAEKLQEIILKRHHTTNLKLRMHGRLHDTLRTWDYAKLFSKYFTISGGNVGVALQSWLANIEDVKEDNLYIRVPQMPDISVLDTLNLGWYLLIIQLMLHKRANLRKLTRICRGSTQVIKENIDILLRSGILMEKNPGVYEINTLLYPYIQRKLIEKDMI